MLSKKVLSMVSAVVVVLALVAGLVVGFSGNVQAAQQAAPQADLTTPALVTVRDGSVGYNATYTSPSRYIGGYTLLQYFAALDVTDGLTVTGKIQSSPDGIHWYDYVTVWDAVDADVTTTPAQTNAIGTYVRWTFTPVTTTLAYTPTVRMVLK